MKLTNLQLRVLSSTIIKKLKQKAIESSKRDEIIERVKKEVNYENVVPIVKKYEKLLKKKNDIQKEISEMSRNFDNESLGHYLPSDIKHLDGMVDSRVNSALFKNIPFHADVESDIVLMSLEGSSDILSKLLAKYGVED